jgi:hypothetical protein
MSEGLDPDRPLPEWRPVPGVGRDPERIDVLLAQLAGVWKQHPQQRLCQLLSNLLDARPNPLFYVEDDAVSRRIFDFLETGQWATVEASPSEPLA